MSIWKLLADLIELDHAQVNEIRALRRENLELLLEQREILRKQEVLHRENLRISREVRDDAQTLKQFVSIALPLLAAINQAVVPEPVATVKLTDESGDNTMDVQVGVPRQLKVDTFGASGNPTVPVGATELTSSNTTDFSVDSSALTLTPTGAPGATTDVTATVDGVTSAPLSYTIAAPAAEPVATVVLSDVTPA